MACLNGAKMCFRCAMASNKTPTGPLKSRNTGKLVAPKQTLLTKLGGPKVVGGVLAGVLVLGAGGWVATHRPKVGTASEGDPPYMGPAAIKLLSPAAGRSLAGNQVFKLDVASPKAADKVTITVDGKYWDTWERDPASPEEWLRDRRPPFTSDWPTGIFRNGPHAVVVAVTYHGGRRQAVVSKKFTIANRR